jgi:hypothetical protein
MRHALACALLLASALSRLAVAYAQTDEIQVYDASIAAPGVFNLTWHNNYTPSGASTPRFPGGLVANHTLNGVPEWAYGVTDWFEAGLYLPLYSINNGGAVTFNGFKLRTLFVVPQADQRSFFYGINFEFSYNTAHWDTRRYTQEIRPIIGARFGPVDVMFNPILDNSYQGFSRLDFAPATRIAYNLSRVWAVAAEEYDDFGPLRSFYSSAQQQHQLYGVVDYRGKPWTVEAGAGFGLTAASDALVIKLILSRDLN